MLGCCWATLARQSSRDHYCAGYQPFHRGNPPHPADAQAEPVHPGQPEPLRPTTRALADGEVIDWMCFVPHPLLPRRFHPHPLTSHPDYRPAKITVRWRDNSVDVRMAGGRHSAYLISIVGACSACEMSVGLAPRRARPTNALGLPATPPVWLSSYQCARGETLIVDQGPADPRSKGVTHGHNTVLQSR
jgi:hypothetical protein